MFPIIRNFITAFCLFVGSIAYAQLEFGYQRAFVLGDSLSDQANLLSTGQAPFLAGPPYFQGAFSNGPVAVKLLADSLGLPLEASSHLVPQNFAGGTNYAVAGAKAGGTDPIDLPTQLGALQAFNPTGFTPTDLFIVFFGGNDIRGTSEMTNRQAFRTLFEATQVIESTINTLIDLGVENIVVINAPNIGAIPETQLLAAGNPNLPRILTFRSRVFNFFLNRSVRRLQRQNDAQIVQFDLFRFFNYLTRNGEDLGYQNSENACFIQQFEPPFGQIYDPDCGPDKFDEFLFFDAIHPTAITHARAANALEAIIPVANVEVSSELPVLTVQ